MAFDANIDGLELKGDEGDVKIVEVREEVNVVRS